MKYFNFLITLFFLPLMVNAQAVNAPFTYQGELTVNGNPANGAYDMSFDAYEMATGGSSLLLFGADIHTNVTVTNGLFTVNNVDFGNLAFSSGPDVWIELAVKPTSSGSYNTLLPRQQITSAPYAIKADFSNSANKANDLNVGGASSGDILSYNGSIWSSASFMHLNANGGTSIGSQVVPPSNGLRVEGSIQIGPLSPLNGDVVALDVNSDGSGSTDDPLRVRKDGTIKFYVDSNGGTSVGSWNTPDTDGLRVKGKTQLESELLVKGTMKQNFASKGLVKYMMYVSCANNNSALVRSVNNTERTNPGTGLFTLDYNISGTCGIEFPDEIGSDAFWLTSSVSTGGIATCLPDGVSSGRTAFKCEIRNSAGILSDGLFMLFVY